VYSNWGVVSVLYGGERIDYRGVHHTIFARLVSAACRKITESEWKIRKPNKFAPSKIEIRRVTNRQLKQKENTDKKRTTKNNP